LGCLVGALFGYALGYYLFDLLGDWLISHFSSAEQFDNVKQQMQSQGFWFVITLGIVPIPFQIAMLAAGATQYSLGLFLLASAIARAIRYFGLALVVYYAGNQAERVIRQHKTKAMIGLSVLIIGIWWLTTVIK
ncbi:YqaA family protein, partial [Pseudoalteromonas sp.]|uniref:YqaA family protein n=1 Tax=Pseudoalteromonas sp. TaxID=53249 RepID=UPI00356B146C